MPISNNAQINELQSLLGKDGFEGFLSSYLNDSQSYMKTIQSAYEQNDNALGLTAVHSLKGEIANIGATELGTLCQKLEIEFKAGQLKNSDVIIQAIQDELQKVNSSLRELL
ncbi:Hpt domain-containing protein [Aquirhabdus sp.]|uniref:Hpt domain-containing protein n=1 Tax=Aquirhabdus sp. TaxID=2824160 RepID=UPI00396C2ED3